MGKFVAAMIAALLAGRKTVAIGDNQAKTALSAIELLRANAHSNSPTIVVDDKSEEYGQPFLVITLEQVVVAPVKTAKTG